jgi:hypothetical protein
MVKMSGAPGMILALTTRGDSGWASAGYSGEGWGSGAYSGGGLWVGAVTVGSTAHEAGLSDDGEVSGDLC